MIFNRILNVPYMSAQSCKSAITPKRLNNIQRVATVLPPLVFIRLKGNLDHSYRPQMIQKKAY